MHMIQSYGRKRARGLSDTQKNNLTDLYKIYGINLPENKVDPKVFFENKFDKIIVEIGFGGGEHLINNAIAKPDIGFIGCEPFENGVGNVLKKIQENKLENIKIYNGDARVLLNLFKDNTIHRTYILFPDPWSKKRHYKRRLLSKEFISGLTKKTILGKDMIIATDSKNYITNILENLSTFNNIKFCNDTNLITLKPSCFLSTRYEEKALAKGNNCYYLKICILF